VGADMYKYKHCTGTITVKMQVLCKYRTSTIAVQMQTMYKYKHCASESAVQVQELYK